MKKIQGTLSAIALSAVTILTLVGCPDNNKQDYYDNNYGYGYPYSGPRYMLMRANQNGGQAEYITVDQPLNNQQDVAQYHRRQYRPMNNGQRIDRRQGYQNVRNDGMYFVEHDEQDYRNPQNGASRQTSYWWNTYNYACSYQTGYWSYRYYCNSNWNHVYAPYSYNWYNNWYWRPTYYYNNTFWYYAQAWNNWYYYQGYYYYYFYMPGYSW